MDRGVAGGDASMCYIVSRTGKLVYPNASGQTQDVKTEKQEKEKVYTEGQGEGFFQKRKWASASLDRQLTTSKLRKRSAGRTIGCEETGTWEQGDLRHKACCQPKHVQAVLDSERRCCSHEHVKKGLAQLSVLLRWEQGAREVAVKWASWLLKLLRKARPHLRALQHLLFTVCTSVLPLVYYSLIRQTWLQTQDLELLRAVDIFCGALIKSRSCFSETEWERIGERIHACHSLCLKVGSCKDGFWPLQDASKTCSSSRLHEEQDFGCFELDVGAEMASDELILSKGVQALVRCAVRERVLKLDLVQNSQSTVSRVCPLSGNRLKVPARGKSCLHQSCFDLETYLQVQSKIACVSRENLGIHQRLNYQTTWRCPICGANASWSELVVDASILRMLDHLPDAISEAHVPLDGSISTASDDGKPTEKQAHQSGEIMQDPQLHVGLSDGLCGIGLPREQIDDICRAVQGITSGNSSDPSDSLHEFVGPQDLKRDRVENTKARSRVGIASDCPNLSLKSSYDVYFQGPNGELESKDVEVTGGNSIELTKATPGNTALRNTDQAIFAENVVSVAPCKFESPSQHDGRILIIRKDTQEDLHNDKNSENTSILQHSSDMHLDFLAGVLAKHRPAQRPKARQKRKARRV